MTNINKTTFFDFPVENDLYVTRPYVCGNVPIRVLITDAGHKFVYCLLYKICSGSIFGENQEMYIHLISARGVIDHKNVFFELEECGFHLLKGWVVTSNIEQAYKDVDYVVLTMAIDEQSGITQKETFIGQIIRERYMMKHIADYCKPGVKIVVTGPSAKYILVQLPILHQCEPRIPPESFTAVTLLDEAIAKANLAARLKTTIDKVKNVVVWGRTYPDVCNATVRTFPPGDVGALEETEVPVHEALQDDEYLQDKFVACILWREIGQEFSRSGMSMAIATARHLKVLFAGSPDTAEIVSMGVLTPEFEPCSIPKGTPSSYPVRLLGRGKWEFREDVKYDVKTHMYLLRSIELYWSSAIIQGVRRAVSYMTAYEETHGEPIRNAQKVMMTEMIQLEGWRLKYYLSPLPHEAIPKTDKEPMTARKSIMWDDRNATLQRTSRSEISRSKSYTRIEFDEVTKSDRSRASMKKKVFARESLILPPIQK